VEIAIWVQETASHSIIHSQDNQHLKASLHKHMEMVFRMLLLYFGNKSMDMAELVHNKAAIKFSSIIKKSKQFHKSRVLTLMNALLTKFNLQVQLMCLRQTTQVQSLIGKL